MKIAWVSHRDIKNGSGGAERADRDMLSVRPEGTTVTQIKPGAALNLDKEDFDQVIVTGLWEFSSREMNAIGRCGPILWLHDVQFSGHWIYEDASVIVALSPQHIEYEREKNPKLEPQRFVHNPGYMDVAPILAQEPWIGTREWALWAHRPEWHKGLDLAAQWAREEDIPLTVLVNRPQKELWFEMSRHEYFVLLSHVFDPGPRVVMEAQLLGCEIVWNDLVGGYFDDTPEELAERLTNAGKQFWDLVPQS